MGNPCKNESQSLRIMVRKTGLMEMSSPDLSPCSLFSAIGAGILDLNFENLAMMINYFISFVFFFE